MKSYEVIRQAVDEPGVKAVAAALKLSPALVYKWCEAAGEVTDAEQSGTKNPLDRVKELFQLTKDHRLIRWICNEAGGFFVRNPHTEKRKSLDESVFDQTRAMVRDFSELLDAVTASVEGDHQIDTGEAELIRQKWEDLKACVEGFTVACEGGRYAKA